MAELIFAFFIAVFLTIIFASIMGSNRPNAGHLFFFILLALVALAASLWVRPVGPTLWNVHWVPIFFVALIVGVLVYILSPKKPTTVADDETEKENSEEKQVDDSGIVLAGGVFWVLVLILTLVIAYGFLREANVF